MSFQVKVSDHIFQPLDKVFSAIEDPNQITKYFVSDASERLAEGKKIIWEFKDYNVKINVEVLKLVNNEQITFNWEANGNKSLVSMSFSSEGKNKTNVVITEDAFEFDVEGIKKAMQQTQGWTDFLCSLKAYLYTGINLRNGKMN